MVGWQNYKYYIHSGDHHVKLSELLDGIDYSYKGFDDLNGVTVLGIQDDSRQIKNGDLFVAVRGYSQDGHAFVEEAIKAGAVAIIAEEKIELDVPCIVVSNSKQILGEIVGNFYKHPCLRKRIVGITGTNGKTTISYMLKHVLEKQGFKCGLIGTVEYVINGKKLSSQNTTPGALQLQKMIHDSEDDVIIIEVSSHALKQGRVNGIKFDLCLFTNLDGEHLDYHSDMEDYFETKALLFEKLKSTGMAIVNLDDLWGEKLSRRLKKENVKVFSIGMSKDADLKIAERGSKVKFKSSKEFKLELDLPGIYNKYNAVFTIMASHLWSLHIEKTINYLSNFKKVPGRFEIFHFPGNKTVVVDYAHTAKGFYYCLNAIRECGAYRIFHVFGFRGNRDPYKRPEMIKMSYELSDYYILTFDDLNEIEPVEMERELLAFHSRYNNESGEVITDRTIAIKRAIDMASDGDWVVITGKGHEEYRHDFEMQTTSDIDTVKKLLHEYSYIKE